jgi:AraC-like DNA-binding protein
VEFLFRQNQQGAKSGDTALHTMGIEKLLLKSIAFERDRRRITKKSHYHTSFEVHVILRGFQVYEVEGERLRVQAGELLIIPPYCNHIAAQEDPQTFKYAFSFLLCEGALSEKLEKPLACRVFPTPENLLQNIDFIARETSQQMPFFTRMVENRCLECVLLLMRLLGGHESDAQTAEPTEGDPRIVLAKQYVEDNVHRSVSVSELAGYCYVSEKHLERLFSRELGCTVMDFVRSRKCQRIEALLADPALTLAEISDRMGFSSECYFNAFFKKHAGMTPGAYRKTLLKQ